MAMTVSIHRERYPLDKRWLDESVLERERM